MMLSGLINVTKLKDALQRGVVDSYTGKSGDEFTSVTIFINDEPDQYGNDASVKMNPVKDQADQKVYIGNLKKVKKNDSKGTGSSI